MFLAMMLSSSTTRTCALAMSPPSACRFEFGKNTPLAVPPDEGLSPLAVFQFPEGDRERGPLIRLQPDGAAQLVGQGVHQLQAQRFGPAKIDVQGKAHPVVGNHQNKLVLRKAVQRRVGSDPV